ncbi:MAG TPA: methyltransferase domain-containing protein [Rubrobacter sp.]
MIGALFGEAARDYDRARRHLVPGFDGFYGAVLESVPFETEKEIRVLDLGAGTGLLSAMVAEKFPRARVTLVDLSVEMLRVARRRLAEEPARFEFRNMDYARKPLPRTGGGYDLVVSALSVHHLTHGDKKELFEKVRRSLAVGGYFVNADQIAGDTPEEDGRYGEWWLRRVREAGVSEEDLAAALLRMRADRNATLAEQLGWLEEAGFEGVGCRYKDHRFAVYGGKKEHEDSEGGKEDDE